MKILITGGAGFIGSNLADRLLKDGHHITIYDNLSREGVYKNLFWLIVRNKRIRFIQGNVVDIEKVNRVVEGIDVIFHFAGQVGVGASIEDPRQDFNDNALGTLNVLEAARKNGENPLVVYASTNKVYGDTDKRTPIDEQQPLSFCTPYGCSKGTGDQYTLDYHRIYGLPTVVLRMSCVYGNRQFGKEEQGWLAHFMLAHLNNKPITIYGDGTQVRDALYIDDYVRLCRELIENKDKVAGKVFNIGGGPENTISVSQAIEAIGHKDVSYADWRPSDQHTYISNISKIKKTIGWEPKIGLDEGLERLRQWAKNPK